MHMHVWPYFHMSRRMHAHVGHMHQCTSLALYCMHIHVTDNYVVGSIIRSSQALIASYKGILITLFSLASYVHFWVHGFVIFELKMASLL